MKEVQKSELLKSLRKKSEEGEKILNDVLNEAGEKDIYIDGLFFYTDDIKKCKETLEKAKSSKNLMELKRFIKEDTIPMGLLYEQKFWKDFQTVIYELYEL